MFADLHAHYPMRVLTDVDPETTARLLRSGRQPTRRDRIRTMILRFANRVANFPSWDGAYRIDPEKLSAGNVGLAMSVLLRPFEEMDLSKPYAAPPGADYFAGLMKDLKAVEEEVATQDPAALRLVHNKAELTAALAAGATALVHAVEGGVLLGDSDAEIEANCATLAEHGVGYVTVAHLFFRQVATNANAFPFIPDRLYDIVFPQRGPDHLTPRGETLVRSLVENRILVDLSHMDPPGIDETLAVMDKVDPERKMPVVSTHAGYRFGKQRYMHDEETLLKIKARRGVVGLIMAQHQLNDGLLPRGERTETIEESPPILFAHIDKIAEITGSHDHVALGSDLDGFIKPSIGGIEDISDLPAIEAPLIERYGQAAAERIMWRNALEMLETLWSEGGAATA